MTLLDESLNRLLELPPEARKRVNDNVAQMTGGMLMVPNPGPQTDAYMSAAEVLLYGGQAGGGKTYLELGWGINEAESGIIFRRELSQTDGLEKEGKRLIAETARFNGQDLEWTWRDGKTLKLGGMKNYDSWAAHAGRERDYIAFDEAGEFLEHQVASILAWLRAAPGKRARMILGSNPPRTSEGLWLVKWFGPWLDPRHPDPAVPGEIRWAVQVTDGGELRMVWVEGPGEYEIDGEPYLAKSYTFIPASLEDNPYRDTPEYKARLQSLQEPLRSQLLYGDFSVGRTDVENQCIPTAWVRDAIHRRESAPPAQVPMCAMGVDCAGGGTDNMVLAPRYDGWYAELIKIPGKDIPEDRPGAYAAGMVVGNRRDNALVIVDQGGGYGGPLFEQLKANNIDCLSYKGAEKTTRRSADTKLGFVNTRSAAYWSFREALDPGQPGGSPISLPDDQRLVAGLTAPTFEVTPHGIKVEPKVVRNPKGKVTGGVLAKLGFSPDEADAVVMAWWAGPKEATSALEWLELRERRVRHPKVITSGRVPLSVRRRA